jgi:hypothetical protein
LISIMVGSLRSYAAIWLPYDAQPIGCLSTPRTVAPPSIVDLDGFHRC